MLLLVLRHLTCASCVAWMCCRMSNSIKHVWACLNQSSRRGHRFLLAIMLLLVIRHPTCASCVAWMCCKMSNSIKHAWACPDQSTRTRTNTNPNGTEANAAGRSGNARALRKQSKCGIIEAWASLFIAIMLFFVRDGSHKASQKN